MKLPDDTVLHAFLNIPTTPGNACRAIRAVLTARRTGKPVLTLTDALMLRNVGKRSGEALHRLLDPSAFTQHSAIDALREECIELAAVALSTQTDPFTARTAFWTKRAELGHLTHELHRVRDPPRHVPRVPVRPALLSRVHERTADQATRPALRALLQAVRSARTPGPNQASGLTYTRSPRLSQTPDIPLRRAPRRALWHASRRWPVDRRPPLPLLRRPCPIDRTRLRTGSLPGCARPCRSPAERLT